MPRLAMRCSSAEVFTVLSHFERKGGFEITRLVARPNGEAFIELAAGAEAIEFARSLMLPSLQSSLPSLAIIDDSPPEKSNLLGI